MIYLDYSATTPMLYDVLDSYTKTSKEYIGNANSLHGLGIKSNTLLHDALNQISELLNIKENELTITSGATEGNNALIRGIAYKYKKLHKKILVSKLEHPSIYEILKVLEKDGFIIEYLEHDPNGLVNFEKLKNSVTKDTSLVIINAVNSELGIRQPLKTLRQIIKKANPSTLIHADMTQAIGKVNVNLHDVDSAVCSAHKFFGPKGIGIMYLQEGITINPLIYGSGKSNYYHMGTTPLPLIVSMAKALRLALFDLDKKEAYVKKLNAMIVEKIKDYPNISINQTEYSIPHILSLSIYPIKPNVMINYLSEKDVYIGTNTACSSNEESNSIMCLYNDKKRASHSIRISISALTTSEEIRKFLMYFDDAYEKLRGFNNEKDNNN